jgi:ubiquinone biosynthesis protein COQ4
VATLSESTASTFLPSLHATMSSHPEGRQILRDRPVVSSQTVDLGMLKDLKRGTLGREYVEWLERGNLSPDSRAKVSWSYRL